MYMCIYVCIYIFHVSITSCTLSCLTLGVFFRAVYISIDINIIDSLANIFFLVLIVILFFSSFFVVLYSFFFLLL